MLRHKPNPHPFWTGSVVILALMLPLTAALAQTCEVPLFVMQAGAGAYVMILADNCGSMNEALYHPGYDPRATYDGLFHTEAFYFVASDGERAPVNFNPAWPVTPNAYLIDSDNGERGRYLGNYLNWIYFHATEDQLLGLPRTTRIQVLKAVLCDLIDATSARLRLGLCVYQNDHFGSIIGKCGVNPVSLKAQVNGITANAWTPTGEAMETILDYFSEDGPNAVIEDFCQYNFLIVVTDGYPTMDREVSGYLHDADGDGNDPGNCESIGAPYNDESHHCTDHMDDVAYYMAHTDLRSDLTDDQIVHTYTIGFHIDAPLLEETAVNGGGLYFTAQNAVELRSSIEWALQDIIRRISSGSAVAVVASERGTDDRLFRGKFMPVSWDGYLEAYELPYHQGDIPLWEAGDMLSQRAPSDRQIITALGTAVYPFIQGNADDLWLQMGAVNEDEAAALIRWGRGEDETGLRDRGGWKLGDIIHSTPVVVGAATQFSPEESYQEYFVQTVARQKMIYVGANDGMLHAFNADSGREEWAFVPEFALPIFKDMADSSYCHRYTCDGTVTVRDTKIGTAWRTILIGGARQGGAGYFCLDVTQPYNPLLLWQTTLPGGVPFSSEAEIVTINSQSVAVIGSGLDVLNGEAHLFAYDVFTGALLGDLLLSADARSRNKATMPEVVDIELDGESDLVYVGDLLGNLWRIDLNHSTSPGMWSVTQFFTDDRPITASPVAAYGLNGSVNVYFGTGAYLDEDDMMTSEQNSFYCLFDRHGGSLLDRRDLADQTNGGGEIGNDQGWYVDLWHESGERVTEQAVVVAQTVYFTAYAPTQTACVSGGTSWLYSMTYDTADVPETEDGESSGVRDVLIGDGIASRPVVDIAHSNVVIQASDATIHIEDIPAVFFSLVVRSWQENYDFVTEPPQ